MNNGSNLSKMEKIRNLQYNKLMDDNDDHKNWDEFAQQILESGMVDFW